LSRVKLPLVKGEGALVKGEGALVKYDGALVKEEGAPGQAGKKPCTEKLSWPPKQG
jgi:hypothetical protein